MKVKVGDKYKLNGACQYGYTRNGIKVIIESFDTVTKIRNNFCDHLRLRSMWMLDGTGCEIHIDDSIIERYFVKVNNNVSELL